MTTLTMREQQCLLGASLGRRNREIGQALHVAEDTVKSHMRKLFKKLGAVDRAHAVRVGFERGLLTVQGGAPVAQVAADWQERDRQRRVAAATAGALIELGWTPPAVRR